MNKNPGKDEGLDRALRQWTVDASLPPRFQEQVWNRIAKVEERSEPALSLGVRRLVAMVLQRPRFAYAYLIVLLASGVAAGSWAAQIKTHRLDAQLSLRYVQSVDPYRADVTQP